MTRMFLNKINGAPAYLYADVKNNKAEIYIYPKKVIDLKTPIAAVHEKYRPILKRAIKIYRKIVRDATSTTKKRDEIEMRAFMHA